MNDRRSSTPRAFLALLVTTVLLALAACGPGGETSDSEASDSAADQSYTVRGEIAAVPGDGMPEGQVRIRHEAIPDFVGYDGEVVGMSAMTMPFPTADDVDLASLSKGDKIEFVLEVSWDGSPPYQITQVRKLPVDIVLDFDQNDAPQVEQSVPGTSPTPP